MAGIALLLTSGMSPVNAADTPPADALSGEAQFLIPQIKKYCVENKQQYEVSHLNRNQYEQFCDCYAVTMAKGVSEEEKDFQRRNNRPSTAYQDLANSTPALCKPK